jgi:hypothetical protein
VPARLSLRRARSVLAAEFDAIRRGDPDLDAGDLATFTAPLTLRLLAVIAIGVVPLIVVRSSAHTDALLVPLIGSFALAAICTAVVAWLIALIISGVVVMAFYRTRPRAASTLVTRIAIDSFARIEDNTARIALLAVVGGLLALAFGLPARTADTSATTVLDDLLAAQLACLIAGLSIAFIAESIRCAADIVDDQSPLLAWPWALAIASIGWSLATVVGPFETTRLITVLLNGWLPPVIDGQPRDQIIAYLIPAGARWWAALGPLPVIAAIWAYQASRHNGLTHIRRFLAEEDTGPR